MSPLDIIAKELDCDIDVKDFELQSFYYVSDK